MNKKSIVGVVGVVAVIVVLIVIIGGGSASKPAEKYLKARYNCDAKTIVSLVPNDVIKAITKEYGCTRSELLEAVEKEIGYDQSEYSDCDKIKSSEISSAIDKDEFDDYLDRRVEDCINTSKIKEMYKYKVDVNNDYYFTGVMVYKYGSKYYSLDATNFVAYAVWELY